ncbi:MAG: helix-turn-helix domain-containing protein [Actinomycetales bacterium]|nr:helix-turn-helix domain-containing protein [Candidatus Phosphoribacter baldrii]
MRRNLRDAARIYGVSDWTLRQAIAAGDLPAVALGSGGRKVYSVRLDDVEAWFRAQPDAFAEMCR